jgi:mRNA interferase MazF
MAEVPDRGDVVWISMNPHAGHGQAGRRPGLVLSASSYNGKVGLAILCPIAGQVKGYPFEVLIPDGLPVTGAVLSDQAKGMDWSARQAELTCRVPRDIVRQVLLRLGSLLTPGETPSSGPSCNPPDRVRTARRGTTEPVANVNGV